MLTYQPAKPSSHQPATIYTVILFAFLLPSFAVHAQHEFQPVDMTLVKQQVTDASKPTYYATLLKRFNAFDTSLTRNDYRLLYYGFVFQKNYNGNMSHHKTDIDRLIAAKKYKEAVALCDSILNIVPVSLVANYLKASALYQLNSNDPRALPYRDRYRKLRDAILSSGDGYRCQSALKVIFKEDENDISWHYFEIKGQPKLLSAIPCDEFDVVPSKYFLGNKLHFDVSEIARKK